jgi:uncharacterized repeat protein (TIGR03803 family)
MTRKQRNEYVGLFGLACILAIPSVPAAWAQAPTETVLHTFTGGADGAQPYAGVTIDPAGNIYGTTYKGGILNAGTVYKIDTSGNESVVYSFTGGGNGGLPYGGVILDPSGNLYGTTTSGGVKNAGVIFKIDTAGNETVLHSFDGKSDGSGPHGTLTFDPSGNLWGTATYGGSKGAGTVFDLSAAGQFSVFYTFPSGNDRLPIAGVILDAEGNLYGTAEGERRDYFPGLAFKLDSAGSATVLHAFKKGDKKGGFTPTGGLVFDSSGNLYGTTAGGGTGGFAGGGIVFEVDASGQYSVLYNFYGVHGRTPEAALTVDPAGNLYGTTMFGGAGAAGEVFELSTAGDLFIVHSFGGPDGGNPAGSVAFDSSGNLYGTTLYGGTGNGVVFKISNVAAPRP